MAADLRRSALALIGLTIVLGLAYPLLITGVGQAVFGNKSDGSLVEHDGKVVGSRLIGQGYAGEPGYFHSRPSVTGYSGNVTFFNNLGPNSRALSRQIGGRVERYLKTERPFNPGLDASGVPVDAVTSSGSGVDPQISEANALIQAGRVADARGIDRDRVDELIDDNTDGRGIGLFGEPGVNVLELNLALDDEAPLKEEAK
jgi:potassium-transporting ATPase KdpC subunit